MDNNTLWNDLNIFNEEGFSVTSLKYDEYLELLWVGYENGRISSYSPLTGNEQCYSSFCGHKSSVLDMISLPSCIVSVSESAVSVHSSGGIQQHKFAIIEQNEESYQHTCAVSFQPSGGLVHSQSYSNVFVGNSHDYAYVYDLNNTTSPINKYNIHASTICAQASITFIAVGGGDGRIRLLDPSFRSREVQHILEGHTGTVSSLSFHKNGMNILSCGYKSRAINPYDPNSPVTYYPDPQVLLYDIRMMRSMTPINLAIPPPCYVSYISNPMAALSANDVADIIPQDILAVSSNGFMQHIPAIDDSNSNIYDTESLQLFCTPSFTATDEYITSCSVSSTGCFVACGTSAGTVIQRSATMAVDEDLIVNTVSAPLQYPNPVPKSPPLSLTVNSPVLASAYMLVNKVGNDDYLCSSIPLSSSNAYGENSFDIVRLPPARKIDPEILSKAYYDGFIGCIKNTNGYRPNSYLCKSMMGKLYEISDPRSKHEAPRDSKMSFPGQSSMSHNMPHGQSASGSSGQSADSHSEPIIPVQYRRISSRSGGRNLQAFNYSAYNQTPFVGLENISIHSWTNPILQLLFSFPEIRDVALQSQISSFHQSRSNTELCELGFVYNMMIDIFQYNTKHTTHRIPSVIMTTNFLISFQQSSEAVAVGLLNDNLNSNNTHIEFYDNKKIQSLIQIFIKFLLNVIKTEIDLENKYNNGKSTSNLPSSPTHKKADVVESIFGHVIKTSNVFIHSNTIEPGSSVNAYSIELNYPSYVNRKKASTGKSYIQESNNPPSFAHVLWRSIDKETYLRGWCNASESYEPLKQSRKIIPSTLPKSLLLLCGDTLVDKANQMLKEEKPAWTIDSLWHMHSDAQGSWLPYNVEIYQACNGDVFVSQQLSTRAANGALVDSPEWIIYTGNGESKAPAPASHVYATVEGPLKPVTVFYTLYAVVSGIFNEREGRAHSVLHMRGEEHSNNADSPADKWVLFNDFNISITDKENVTKFPEYRFPCVVLFVQKNNVSWPCTSLVESLKVAETATIPSTVLRLPSLSSHQSLTATTFQQTPSLNGKNFIAFDAEFVSVEVAKTDVDTMGQRTINHEGRQVLARISIIDGNSVLSTFNDPTISPTFAVFADDYVLPSEKVVDYVTRFSGLLEDDLNPATSRHAVVSPRTAYLKLRYFIDNGYIFIGHGLQKDFETANIFISPQQILDTVELWRLPHQRKISLRFLASYFLKMEIQDDIHDSIEDAKTALLLYRHFLQVKSHGEEYFQNILQELYAFGSRTNWTIGLDRIEIPSQEQDHRTLQHHRGGRGGRSGRVPQQSMPGRGLSDHHGQSFNMNMSMSQQYR